MKHSIHNKLLGLWCSIAHHTRKNSHLKFFIRGFYLYVLPGCLARRRLRRLLNVFHSLPAWEQAYITRRVDYYCKFSDEIFLPENSTTLGNFTYRNRTSYIHDYVNSTYFFDAYEYIRFFPKHLRWAYNPGDVNYLFPIPEITKSRPLTVDNSNRNNILLNLDKVRHFTWVYDPFTWEQKECRILFRGDVHNKPRRVKFLKMWSHHPICDLVGAGGMSLFDHLYYRYIMALEGNDVASNLKWVMSSNSIAVMPKPTCETWYMEGQLIPNYHYIEIASDYHDLIERITYYEQHPEEAKAIIQHAHEWVEQFRNPKREDLISLMVLEKYFTLTGQRGKRKTGQQHYLVNDLVKLSSTQKFNAQGKAREDVAHTLCTMGYETYDIINHKYSWGEEKRYHHYPVISKYIAKKQARAFIERIKPGDTVFIQDFYLDHMQYIARECQFREINVVFLVHDIQCIRFGIITHEVQQLNNATLILVHTEAMAIKLRSIGVIVPMRVIQLFDYYSADPMQDIEAITKRKNEIVFAGNLAKSEFLKKLANDTSYHTITFNLYGMLGNLNTSKNSMFHYCGIFSPDNTGSIRGGWGLIWDGDSIDTCVGIYGEYLRYNASHKTSLYLVCGMPVIVWEKSSLANWVKKENVGIIIPNLRCIDKCIAEVKEDEYKCMIANARVIGSKLRNGEYLKTILKDIGI